MSPDQIAGIAAFFKEFGFPGGLLILIGYTLRKIVLWAYPHAERMIAAYIKRQETMEECQKKLTDSTIEIQREALGYIKEIRKDMPLMCLAKNYPCLRAGHEDGKESDKG